MGSGLRAAAGGGALRRLLRMPKPHLQPPGPRIASDGTRVVERMGKRKGTDGWETIDHACVAVHRMQRSSDAR